MTICKKDIEVAIVLSRGNFGSSIWRLGSESCNFDRRRIPTVVNASTDILTVTSATTNSDFSGLKNAEWLIVCIDVRYACYVVIDIVGKTWIV